MLGPITVLVTALAAASVVEGAHAAPCTAPTKACAAEKSPPAGPPRSAARHGLPWINPIPRSGTLLSLHARAAKCMGAYASAILRQGVADEGAARHFVVGHCGKEMHEWNQREEGLAEEESFAMLDGLAGAALDAERPSARPTRPPPKPARPTEPQIEYDVQKARDRDTFLKLYAQTAACMREGSVAMLRQGLRDRGDIQAWTVQTCGRTLVYWLTDRLNMTEKQVSAMLTSMSEKALDAALRGPDAIIVR